MSEGVSYLVEGVTFPPLPFPSVSFSGENLDHVGRMTMAPFASLPRWRRCLGGSCRWWSTALFGEDPLLCLPSLSFHYIVQVPLVGGCFTAPLFVGGYFAAVLLWWMLCCRRRWSEFSSGGCFAAAVGWSGGCFATCLHCRSLHLWRRSLFLQAQ